MGRCWRGACALSLALGVLGGHARADTAGGAEPAPAAAAAPAAGESAADRALALLKTLEFSGGLSAGWYYASRPGPDTSDNEALVSNFLVVVSSADKEALVGFQAGVGGTAAPTLLSAPDPDFDFRVEYASLALRPLPGGELAVGLLQPLAGYEDSYTYNNRNAVSGMLAAAQPYNAYGARVKYSLASVELAAGYYSRRLDRDEYAVDADGDGEERHARRSWELSVAGEVGGLGCRAHHYQLEGMKGLTGGLLEYTLGDVYLALNADYWRWTDSLSGSFDRRWAAAAALYVAPTFGRFSVPLRVEYVNQGESRMYVDNADTKTLWSATVTPTLRLAEKAYVRVEASWVHGKDAFENDDGDPKSGRVYLAGEVGYVF